MNSAAIDTVMEELKANPLVALALAELIRKRGDASPGIMLVTAFALGVLYARKQLHPETQQEPENAPRQEP